MAKTMFMDCKSCGTRFDWEISQDDPICPRCKVLQGSDPRKILGLVAEHKVPGQKEFIKILGLILDRLDKLDGQKAEPKKGMFS